MDLASLLPDGGGGGGASFVPQEALTLTGHAAGVTALALRHDGTLLLSGCADGEVRAWHPASGAALGVWRGHRKAVWALAFSPCGAWAFSAGGDRAARVWRAADGACEAVLEGAHTRDVLCLAADEAAAPREAALYTGGADGALHAWRCGGERTKVGAGGSGGGLLGLAPAASARGAHAGALRCLLRDPHSQRIFTAGADGVVRVWLRPSPAELHCAATLAGHTKAVSALALHVPPRGAGGACAAILYSASEDGAVRAWDVAGAACLALLTLPGRAPLRCMSLSRDGDEVFVGAADGRAAAWRAAARGAGAHTTPAPEAPTLLEGHASALRCIAVADDELLMPPPQFGVADSTAAPPTSAVFSAGLDCAVRRWRRGECTAVLRGHEGAVAALLVSRHGGALFSGGADGCVRVWALAPLAPPGLAGVRSCAGALRAQHARASRELRAAAAAATAAALKAVAAPHPPLPGAAALRRLVARAAKDGDADVAEAAAALPRHIWAARSA